MGIVVSLTRADDKEVMVSRVQDDNAVELVFEGRPALVDEAVLAQLVLYPPHLFGTSVQLRTRLKFGRVRVIVARSRFPRVPCPAESGV